MRDAQGFAPPSTVVRRRRRIAPALVAAALLAGLACYVVPRGLDANTQLASEDDPAQIADRALDHTFDAELAQREIAAALAAKDPRTGAELRRTRRRPPRYARCGADGTGRCRRGGGRPPRGMRPKAFALGLATGEPNDMAGLAGTTLGDLFVFGDIRDAVREGGRMALGQPADELVLGLACVGLAITAGTYATLGATAPARVGLSVAKAARKTGQLGGELASYMARALRGVVDWGRLKQAIVGASISDRRWRCAPCARRSRSSAPAASCIWRATSAGCRPRPARRPRSIASRSPRRRARWRRWPSSRKRKAARPRAILKTLGRGAIALTMAAFDLGPVDSRRVVQHLPLRVVAQERDRTRHAALSSIIAKDGGLRATWQ